jgi:adenosylmethionine-8-amino-7-oxononanoate aminotransferase
MNQKKRNKKFKELDKRYIWHPFTQMKDWLDDAPLIIEKGKGSYLIDIYGRKYLDGVSSLWVTVHGHRKKEIDTAVKKQIDKIAHSTLLGLSNVPAIILSEKLIKIAPKGLSKVFYSDSGSTAVEIALKMAFQYWQQKGAEYKNKTKFISLYNAYHGDTIGSVSVGGIDLFHQIYKPLLFDTYKIESPYCYRCSFNKTYPECNLECADYAEEMIKKYADTTAALIIEPIVQGAAGMLVAPDGYLKKIRAICTKYNILMIADEVATGFGRTGKMFACEHEGVSPDIMAVAKGITGGYLPLAATLTTKEVYNAFYGEYKDLKAFFHGHTYTGNPLACAAAIANTALFKKERTLQKLQPKIKYLTKRLKEFESLKHVGDIRQKGFMVGIELVKGRETKMPYQLEEKIGIKVIKEARKQGLIIRPLGNVIVLMPPLSIKPDELKKMLDVVYVCIKEVTGKGK